MHLLVHLLLLRESSGLFSSEEFELNELIGRFKSETFFEDNYAGEPSIFEIPKIDA